MKDIEGCVTPNELCKHMYSLSTWIYNIAQNHADVSYFGVHTLDQPLGQWLGVPSTYPLFMGAAAKNKGVYDRGRILRELCVIVFMKIS
jgi:hypothetical protein